MRVNLLMSMLEGLQINEESVLKELVNKLKVCRNFPIASNDSSYETLAVCGHGNCCEES